MPKASLIPPQLSLIPAVAYIRMSSKKQDKSPAQQREEIIQHARRKNYQIIRWYQDDGKSGGKETEKREAFLRIIDDAERLGDFVAILTWNKLRFDRLDPLEGAQFKLRLRDCGVILDTIADGVFDWATEEGQLLDTFHSMKGHKDLLQISRECIRGKVDAFNERGRPLGGQPPYGMARLVTDDKGRQTLVPRGEKFRSLPDWDVIYVAGDPQELEVVRWLFETIASKDVSPYWLSRDLNKRGVPSPHGGLWRDTSVRRLLKDRAYVGDLVAGMKHVKESFHRLTKHGAVRSIGPRGRLAKSQKANEDDVLIKPGRWAAVIAAELFDTVQQRLDSLHDTQRKPRTSDAGYPLSGTLYCGHCGSRLVGNPKMLRGQKIRRYHCGKFMNTGNCGGWKIDEHEIMGEALKMLRENLTPEKIASFAVRPDAGPSESPIERLRKRLEVLDKAIQQGNRRFCMVSDRAAEALRDEIERMHAEREQVEAQLKNSENPADVAASIGAWAGRNSDILKLRMVPTSEKVKQVCSDGVERELPVCELVEPLELRRAFHEIGMRLEVFWKQREKRTRAGKYQLERVEASLSLDRLITTPPSDRRQSTLR